MSTTSLRNPSQPWWNPTHEHYVCFSRGDLDGFHQSESEVEAVYFYTDSARLERVLSVSSTSIEDDFLEDLVAV